jgi:hypothetical protein
MHQAQRNHIGNRCSHDRPCPSILVDPLTESLANPVRPACIRALHASAEIPHLKEQSLIQTGRASLRYRRRHFCCRAHRHPGQIGTRHGGATGTSVDQRFHGRCQGHWRGRLHGQLHEAPCGGLVLHISTPPAETRLLYRWKEAARTRHETGWPTQGWAGECLVDGHFTHRHAAQVGPLAVRR